MNWPGLVSEDTCSSRTLVGGTFRGNKNYKKIFFKYSFQNFLNGELSRSLNFL